MDLPRVPVSLTREELQYAFDPAVQAKGFVIQRIRNAFRPRLAHAEIRSSSV